MDSVRPARGKKSIVVLNRFLRGAVSLRDAEDRRDRRNDHSRDPSTRYICILEFASHVKAIRVLRVAKPMLAFASHCDNDEMIASLRDWINLPRWPYM